MNDEKKAHGKCLYCGKEFDYIIPAKIFRAHPNLVSLIQPYCSPECENEERRQFEKKQKEIESQNTFKQKYCPQCGFAPKFLKYRELKNCPYCKIPFEFREVIRWRERRKELEREYRERKKNATVQTTD